MDGQQSWLTRKEAAAVLDALGYPVDFRMLARLAAKGAKQKGPPFRRFMRRVRYERVALEAWAKAICQEAA